MNESINRAVLYEDVTPMQQKRAAIVVGRFSPPTRGHYAVIDSVKQFIRENSDLKLEANPIVIVIGGSKSDSDLSKNPLSVDERIKFMEASGNANGVKFFTAKNAFEAFGLVRAKGFEPIAIAAGTDRINDYIRILDNYFKTEDDKPIEHFKIHLKRDESAIETDAVEKKKAMDSILTAANKNGQPIDTNLVSGSLARRAVELGYEKEFADIVGLVSKPALAKKMFNKIAKAMGI
jgi:hypothetical protein